MTYYSVRINSKAATSYNFPEINDRTKEFSSSVCLSLENAIAYAHKFCGPDVLPEILVIDSKYYLGDNLVLDIIKYESCVHTTHCCDECKVCKYNDPNCPCCNDTNIVPSVYGCNCGW